MNRSSMDNSDTDSIISIKDLSKIYGTGFQALKNVNLEIKKGEIFALLGPNGAGKTTLISVVSGIVKPSSGTVSVGGFDILKDFRTTRSKIGLVPQELSTDMFETPWKVINFSRGLFGKPNDPKIVEKIIKSLSLWDKRNDEIRTLSGGMKRRVMIAKALAHEPSILFLDEPTAGVDVNLRREMWDLVGELRESGVTIILTTHYIEEAQAMADRIGVIDGGKIVIVEEKSALMHKLGKKKLSMSLKSPLLELPHFLKDYPVVLDDHGKRLTFTFDTTDGKVGVSEFMKVISEHGLVFKDLETKESSLEEIFLTLLGGAS